MSSRETTLPIWRGRTLVTYGDMMEHGIDTCASREEAQQFMATLAAHAIADGHDPAIAASNIGYLSGYYSHADMRRIQDWFDVAHPIFGRSSPTPEEAFAAGLELGEKGAVPDA